MLWKKSWRPELVMLLAGGIVLAFFSGNLAVDMLRSAGVTGFKTPDSPGAVVAATLSFHGAVLVLGAVLLKLHDITWREVFGLESSNWKRDLLLAGGVLLVMLPVMLGLKLISEIGLQKIGWPLEDQRAVDLLTNAKSIWLRAYLAFFAVIIAPVAEEFIFRGLLFSTAKQLGWTKLGWVGVSLLFALIHINAPTFLPLFVFALALTWLYERTEGLLAPIAAHSLFNAANLVLLLLLEKPGGVHP